jgi:protein TonB
MGAGIGAGAGAGGGSGAGAGGTGLWVPAAVVEMPEPAYPRHSRIRGEEGTVVLETEITAEGKPAGVRVVRSSGHRRLDDAALEAMGKAAFAPARALGRPVASTRRIAVRFELREREVRSR